MRLLVVIGCLTAALGVCLHTLLDADGWGRRERLRQDLETLQAVTAQIQKRAASVRDDIDALRSQPQFQEHVIRRELGYIKNGEVVLELAANR